MIWRVYDSKQPNGGTRFFRDKYRALQFKRSQNATTSGAWVVRWCHAASVPDGATIH